VNIRIGDSYIAWLYNNFLFRRFLSCLLTSLYSSLNEAKNLILPTNGLPSGEQPRVRDNKNRKIGHS